MVGDVSTMQLCKRACFSLTHIRHLAVCMFGIGTTPRTHFRVGADILSNMKARLQLLALT